MRLRCKCGAMLTDIGYPSNVENLLLSTFAQEKLQDLVDQEVARNGHVDEWPEHWEEAGSIDVWRCEQCSRLYLNAKGPPEEILIYALEQKGLPGPE